MLPLEIWSDGLLFLLKRILILLYMRASGAGGAMRVAWLCSLCMALAPMAFGQQSTLKVAACNPGSVPYVDTDDSGNLIGYDIGRCNETVHCKPQITKAQ